MRGEKKERQTKISSKPINPNIFSLCWNNMLGRTFMIVLFFFLLILLDLLFAANNLKLFFLILGFEIIGFLISLSIYYFTKRDK